MTILPGGNQYVPELRRLVPAYTIGTRRVPDTMRTATARFLQYLTVERNASAYTVKSYREDLTALAEYLTEGRGGACPRPEEITVLELRGYVAALHEAGYAKTSIARRLASLRSFFKFGQREGWTKTNPAKPLRNPRKGRTLPHLPVCLDFKDGKLYPNDRPGLGVEVDFKPLRQIAEIAERVTHRAQTYFRPDGSITNW